MEQSLYVKTSQQKKWTQPTLAGTSGWSFYIYPIFHEVPKYVSQFVLYQKEKTKRYVLVPQ